MKNHHSFKVFIVEDDVWYGSMLQHYLSLNPEYEVKRFESPRDFFAQLHENPEVVTLDYSLPDCDGAEVLKKIKEHNPDIRVIVISGQQFGSASEREPDFLYMAMKLGAVSSLQKPFRPNELLAAVAKSLSDSP